MTERYPLLKAALDRVEPTEPPARESRCGPWDEQADGRFVCRKCGEVDAPGSGPNGF